MSHLIFYLFLKDSVLTLQFLSFLFVSVSASDFMAIYQDAADCHAVYGSMERAESLETKETRMDMWMMDRRECLFSI